MQHPTATSPDENKTRSALPSSRIDEPANLPFVTGCRRAAG